MTDDVVPNFKARSAKGEVFFNAMSALESTLNSAKLGGPLIFTGNALQCSAPNQYQSIYEFGAEYPLSNLSAAFAKSGDGWWISPPILSNGEIENALDEASTRCHSERGRPPTNLWETIAERKQSYVMLHSYMESVKLILKGMYADVLNERRNSPFRKLAKAGSRITAGAAGAWLISRYGLLPLISDIQTLLKQLRASLDEAERHTARGKAVVGRSTQSSISYIPSGNHIVQNGYFLYTDEITVRATSLDEWKLTILDHFGLGSKDLVTLPWELLTLSFVADWFVNIGDFVGAIVPTPGVNQLGSCISYKRVRSTTCVVTGYSPLGIASVTSSATMSKTGSTVERVRFPGLRTPSLVILNRSKIDPDLDKNRQRIVDAAALIGQRLAGIANLLLRKFPKL
jgi:hypothetical protein